MCIVIVTPHSPVTCTYIYSPPPPPLSLSVDMFALWFSLLAACVWRGSHGPASRGASHQAQGRESIFGCFATRHVYMSAACRAVHLHGVRERKKKREKNNLVTKYHEDTGRPCGTIPSLLFPHPHPLASQQQSELAFRLLFLTFICSLFLTNNNILFDDRSARARLLPSPWIDPALLQNVLLFHRVITSIAAVHPTETLVLELSVERAVDLMPIHLLSYLHLSHVHIHLGPFLLLLHQFVQLHAKLLSSQRKYRNLLHVNFCSFSDYLVPKS